VLELQVENDRLINEIIVLNEDKDSLQTEMEQQLTAVETIASKERSELQFKYDQLVGELNYQIEGLSTNLRDRDNDIILLKVRIVI
jgi:hypothetical protein